MKDRLIQASRVISALLLLWGVAALALPRQIADVVGLTVETGSGNGFAEIGAMHGGMSLALGAIGLIAARRDDDVAGALFAALGAIFFAVGFGRLFVMVVTTPIAAGITAWGSFAAEIAFGAVYFLAGRTSDD